MEPLTVRTLGDAEAAINSLRVNDAELARRLRLVEKVLDTRATPLWRRMIFRLDGWPSWPFVVTCPRWRPWRRWWGS